MTGRSPLDVRLTAGWTRPDGEFRGEHWLLFADRFGPSRATSERTTWSHARCDFRQRGIREHFQQHALPFLPDSVHPAGRLQRARTGSVGANVKCNRTFDRLDYIAEGDLRGGARELIAATGAAPRLDQSTPHQVANHFFQVVLGNLLVPGDFASARDSRRTIRQVDHGTQRVLDLARYLHQAHRAVLPPRPVPMRGRRTPARPASSRRT